MPNTPSDEDLLNAFVKSLDEQAFRRLAERYSSLIFHTALRTLNDRSQAEDVAQRVLGVLAKKAAQVASGNAPLAAWLHRTTILEAKSARRTESRHHRKKEALMHAASDSPELNDPAWKDALPHLDAAIDTLPEADRAVLLLHFVNEMTFPEIAARVGKSAAAVQKQSRRALESLQRILGRRGVTLSLGILTAGLTAEMAKAAPVLLIPAFSSLGKTTTSVIVVKKSTLAALATTLLLCGIPLARQQASISQLESKLSTAASASPDRRISSRSSVTKTPSMIERLARDLKAQNVDVPRYWRAVDFIDSLSDDELVQLARETTVSSLPVSDRENLFGQLFDTLAKRNMESALNSLLEQIPQSYVAKSSRARNLLINGMRDLAENDSGHALAWFNNHLAGIRNLPTGAGIQDGTLESEMRFSLSYGFIFSDAPQAIEILRNVPDDILVMGLWRLAQSKRQLLQKQPEGPIQIVRELLPEKEACKAIAEIASAPVTMDNKGLIVFKFYADFIDQQDLSSAEIEAILTRAGMAGIHPTSAERSTTAKRILHYRNWLESMGYERPDWRAGAVVAKFITSHGADKESYFDAILHRETMGLSNDAALGFLSSLDTENRITSSEVERIEKIATSVGNPEAVQDVVDRIKKNFNE